MLARMSLCLGVALALGCHEPDECKSWADFPASLDIDLSMITECGQERPDSTTEEVAAINACMKAAYDAGELARSSYSYSEEGHQADVVYYTSTWYVRPPGHEPRYVAYYSVRKLFEDNSSEESNSALACDEVESCDAGICCAVAWRRLCP